jgi:hypothetical protein
MRRALGLDDGQTAAPEHQPLSPATTVAHRPPRRFVRDGEVPVSIVHRDRDDGGGTNKLEAARQAVAEQVAAREHAEQLLHEAEATVRDLQTKLGHERIAHEETAHQLEGEMQAMRQTVQALQDQLLAERTVREQAEHDRDQAIAARQEAEGRLREAMATQEPRKVSTAPRTVRSARRATKTEVVDLGSVDAVTDVRGKARSTVPNMDAGGGTVKQVRRRGQPRKAAEPEGAFVEWWKPGWQEKFR